MKISMELASMARKLGICDEWHKELQVINNKERLLEMYIKGIDFCLSNNFPPVEYIRKNFVGAMEQYGIYLDEQAINMINGKRLVTLGRCSGVAKISDYNISEIYIKHQSNLFVSAKNNAFVMIDIFDNAALQICARDNAKVVVNTYGGFIRDIQKYDNSQVKIKVKNKKSY